MLVECFNKFEDVYEYFVLCLCVRMLYLIIELCGF